MAERLPDWATKRCHDCGELFLPGFGAVWSSRRPDYWTHGGLEYCEAQAAYAAHADVLPLQVKLMHQALIEASGVLHRFVAHAEDENWNPEVASTVFTAVDSIERGEKAHKLVAAHLASPMEASKDA